LIFIKSEIHILKAAKLQQLSKSRISVMKKFAGSILLVVLIISAMATLIYAQDTSWDELNTQVVKLYKQGRYKEAAQVAEKALKVAKETFGANHPKVAINLNNLGSAWHALSEYQKAIELYEQALTIDRKVYGDEHPQVTIGLNNLGSAWHALGEYQKAITLFKQALL